MENREIKIKLENIRKVFNDGTVAVNEINLDIYEGEILVLVGPSGCGKTTTLRLIGGLEDLDYGKIIVDKKDMSDTETSKRNIGIVFQKYALFPNMTVEENIGYGLKVKKQNKNKIKERVKELLNLFQISNLAQKKPANLSGGQQQRVALARALAVEPKVLLLDEPLSALDAKLRKDLRVEITRILKKLNITSIFVTHDQIEAMSIGDRIVVMNKGNIEQIGSPREVYRHPKTKFVANFIGTTNILQGELVINGDYKAINIGFCEVPVNNNIFLKKDINDFPVMLRPEDIFICNDNYDFKAKIKDLFFLGEKVMVYVETEDNQEIVIVLTEDYEAIKNDSWVKFKIKENAIYSWEREMRL